MLVILLQCHHISAIYGTRDLPLSRHVRIDRVPRFGGVPTSFLLMSFAITI